MAPRNATRPATALANSEPRKSDLLGGEINSANSNSANIAQAPRASLIDKHGHRHSEAIFRNWSPAAIKALGIRRVGDDPEGGL